MHTNQQIRPVQISYGTHFSIMTHLAEGTGKAM